MSRVGRAASTVRWRLTVAEVIRRCGVALVWGAGLALVWAIASKLIDVGMPWWLGCASVLALAGVVGGVLGAMRRPSLLAAAEHLDRTLRLQDRVSTGLTLEQGPGNDAFARVARDDAETAAAAAQITRATPIRFGRAWGVWPAVAGVAVAVGVWVPVLNWGARSAMAQREQEARSRAAAIENVQQATSALRSVPRPDSAQPATQRSLDELREIELELANGSVSPQSAAERTAKTLNDAADKLDHAATEREQQDAALRQALARSSQTSRAAETPLTRALRSGDLAEAKRAAQDLLRPGSIERSRSQAEELERLAKDLDEADRRQEQQHTAQDPLDEKRGSAATSPREPDLPSGSRSTAREQSPVSEQAPAADASQPERAPRTDNPARELAERLREVAQKMRDRPSGMQDRAEQSDPHQSRDAPNPSSRPQDATRQPSTPVQQPASPERASPKDQRESGKDQTEQRSPLRSAERESSESEQSNSGETASQPANSPTNSSTDASKSGERAAEPKTSSNADRQSASKPSKSPNASDEKSTASKQPAEPAPGAQPRDGQSDHKSATRSAERAESSNPNSPNGPKQPSSEPKSADAEASERRSADQRSDTPAASKHDDFPSPGELPKPDEQAVKRLADQLDRLSKLAKQSQQDRRESEKLRQKAQEAFERMSPEQKSRVQEWAQALAKEQARRGNEPSPQNAPRESPEQQGGTAPSPMAGATDEQSRSRGDGAGRRPSGTQDTGSARSQAAHSGSGDQAGSNAHSRPDQVPQSPPPTSTELVDARSKDPADKASPARVAAEWLGSGQRGLGGESSARQVFESAAKSAARAVEDQTIPKRFDRLVERYFRRLPEQATKGAPPAQTAPVEPAKDAP